jgi:hypothetical protein
MRRFVLLAAAVLLAACSEPPRKEIDQAQGALDAARAAGAVEYAKDEYAAAASALQKAHDAVDQRDYRQALSYAMDARERAQDAARAAADGKAAARSKAEARIATVDARVHELTAAIADAPASRVTPRELRGPKATLTSLQAALQEARTALAGGRFDEAVARLRTADAVVDGALAALEEAAQPPRRRGR